MSRKHGKVLSILLVGILMLTSLSGCGNSEKEKSNSIETKEAVGEEELDAGQQEAGVGKRTVVTMSMWDAINKDYNFVEAFNASQDEIELQIVSIPDSYSEKINAMIVSNTAPDIILAW